MICYFISKIECFRLGVLLNQGFYIVVQQQLYNKIYKNASDKLQMNVFINITCLQVLAELARLKKQLSARDREKENFKVRYIGIL